MTRYTINWKTEIRNTLLIGLIGGPSVFIWCRPCLINYQVALVAMSYSALQWILLWQGNAHLSNYLSFRFPWLENPKKRFLLGVLGVVIYTPIAVYGLYLFYHLLYQIEVDNIHATLPVAIGITFLISFFLNAWSFLDHWKKAALEAERLKKEQMATQYEALKNQVNPHFLFNSLNVLTNLVYEDQDMAADFIRQLSSVYRYVLETRSQEVVPLSTEMTFVESYIFLQKMRFDDKLKVNIRIEGYEKYMVPPMAIQMLIENAIKHNTIAEEEPLNIDLSIENGEYLVVSNNLQKKNIPPEPSSGMGISNIKSRYGFLSEKPVEAIETEEAFVVKLPLIHYL